MEVNNKEKFSGSAEELQRRIKDKDVEATDVKPSIFGVDAVLVRRNKNTKESK